MLRALSAMAGCAALAASVFIAIPAMVNASAPIPAAKDDLADIGDCELRSWPYYARSCLRDEARNAGRVPRMRLVTTDRVYRTAGLDTAAAGAGAPADAGPEAPASWMMSDDDIRVYRFHPPHRPLTPLAAFHRLSAHRDRTLSPDPSV